MRAKMTLGSVLLAAAAWGAFGAEIHDLKVEARAPSHGSMVQDYYLGKVKDATEKRRQRLDAVTTREQAKAYVESVRAKIAESFGPLPERTPLDAQVTGVSETDKLRIEKVIFHSRPGFPVTGLFYLPKSHSGGKLPAVLALCGHSGDAKAGETYQTVSQNMALKGYAVLMIDPVGQGERRQFVGAKNAEKTPKDKRNAARNPK